MSIFPRLKSTPRPLGSADAAAVLAERKTHAAQEAAAAEAAHDAYRAALSDAALVGIALDTPAVEKAHREYERARERAERAREACDAAQAQHDAAVAREQDQEQADRWDRAQALAAARTKAAREHAKALAAAGETRAAFEPKPTRMRPRHKHRRPTFRRSYRKPPGRPPWTP